MQFVKARFATRRNCKSPPAAVCEVCRVFGIGGICSVCETLGFFGICKIFGVCGISGVCEIRGVYGIRGICSVCEILGFFGICEICSVCGIGGGEGGGERIVRLHFGVFAIVQSCAPQSPVGQVKSGFSRQMQNRPRIRRQPNHIPRIRRNLRIQKHDVKHCV